MKEKIKEKITKKGIIIFIVCCSVISGILIFSLNRNNPSENKKILTEKRSSETVEIKNYFHDYTGQYSKKDIKKLQCDNQSLIDGYTGTLFNFNNDTQNYNDKLNSYFSDEIYSEKCRNDNNSQYETFKEMGVTSAYEKFTPYSVVITENDSHLQTMTVIGLTSIDYKSNRTPHGKYDVASKFNIIKEKDKEWKIYSASFTTIYESGSVKLYGSYNNTNINFKGKKINSFS